MNLKLVFVKAVLEVTGTFPQRLGHHRHPSLQEADWEMTVIFPGHNNVWPFNLLLASHCI